MPVLLIQVNDNNVPDSPYKHFAREVVNLFEGNHEFGSAEIPSAGNFYHIEITNKTFNELEIYLQKWRHDPTVQQLQHDPQTNQRRIEVTSTMVSVTGKHAFTQVGVQALMSDLDEGILRFRISTILEQNKDYIALASEGIAINPVIVDAVEAVEDFLNRIKAALRARRGEVIADNTDYISAPRNIAYVSHNVNSFKFDITADISEKDVAISAINEAVEAMQYARTRWRATQEAMTFLAANGGTASGTAAQVAGFLRDGLLD